MTTFKEVLKDVKLNGKVLVAQHIDWGATEVI
jgi:hypothetical protein